MQKDLPKNVHLLTLESWKQNSILVRFEHIFAKGESAQYSQPVTFDFKDVFRGINVASMRETTLGANQWLSEVERLQFKAKTEADSDENSSTTEIPWSTEIPSSTEFSNEPNEVEDETSPEYEDKEMNNTNFEITLNPMEIRTFVVKLK